jgi:hypothetical protein
MAMVRNVSKSSRGFTAFAEYEEGSLVHAIDSVLIEPGEVAEVADRFLGSDGAKALFKAGDVELVSDSDDPADPEPKPKIKGKGGAK